MPRLWWAPKDQAVAELLIEGGKRGFLARGIFGRWPGWRWLVQGGAHYLQGELKSSSGAMLLSGVSPEPKNTLPLHWMIPSASSPSLLTLLSRGLL
jgi:hypothetical protein